MVDVCRRRCDFGDCNLPAHVLHILHTIRRRNIPGFVTLYASNSKARDTRPKFSVRELVPEFCREFNSEVCPWVSLRWRHIYKHCGDAAVESNASRKEQCRVIRVLWAKWLTVSMPFTLKCIQWIVLSTLATVVDGAYGNIVLRDQQHKFTVRSLLTD